MTAMCRHSEAVLSVCLGKLGGILMNLRIQSMKGANNIHEVSMVSNYLC